MAAPHMLALATSAATVAPGGVLTVTGAVYDAAGDPVPDQAVSLAASAAGGGPAGTIAPTVTTDVYGGFTPPSGSGGSSGSQGTGRRRRKLRPGRSTAD